MTKTLISVFKKIESLFFLIAKITVILMMFLIVIDALGRYIFNFPVPGAYKLVEGYLMVIITFLSLSYVMKLDGHISMNLVINKFPLKARIYIYVVLMSLASILVLIIGYLATTKTFNAYQHKLVEIGVINWPVWLVYVWVSIGCFLFFIRILITIIQTIIHQEIYIDSNGKKELHL